jgi:hypothetical protein
MSEIQSQRQSQSQSQSHVSDKKRKLSKTKILKKCVDVLCDDLINFIFTFIGFQGVKAFKMHMLKEKVYEKYKEYRFNLLVMYTIKAREMCSIINKLTNYGIVMVAKAIHNYTNLFKNVRDEWKIEYYKDKIINLYENLCKKNLLRSDYEFSMRAWGSPTIKKTLDHFLTFDYPSLNNERKNYLPLFDDIMNIGRQYSL